MRVLFDQGTPAPLRHALVGHSVQTAFELGWATLQNGALIAAAEKIRPVPTKVLEAVTSARRAGDVHAI